VPYSNEELDYIDGHVGEGSAENLFLVRDDVVITRQTRGLHEMYRAVRGEERGSQSWLTPVYG
jgi:hypothetical protein